MAVILNARQQSIGIILTIALLSTALGIFLDGEVVTEPINPVSWEAQEKEAPAASIKPLRSSPQKSFTTLNEEATALQQEGERVIARTDTLITQAGFTIKKKSKPPTNDKIADIIKEMKSRLGKINK
ncbi:MAG: hypothetical protein ABW168_06375 [Sedimenticola sp.]